MSGTTSRISTSTISHQDGVMVPSLGRALSTVGSTKGSVQSRDESISVISEDAVGEMPNSIHENIERESKGGGDGGLERKGTMGRMGLKRLSSLMRR